MNRCLLASMVVLAAASVAQATDRAVVTLGVEGDIADPALGVGDVITIPLAVHNQGPEGIGAVTLEVACRGPALGIRSVTFDPAFAHIAKPLQDPSLATKRSNLV